MKQPISPTTFISKLLKKNELGEPFRLMPFQEEILNLAFCFDENGRLPWDTIVYSTIKKSGKSALAAMITLYWAFTQEPPNELLLLANDLEQSLARVFRTCEGLIQHNPALGQEAEVQQKVIYLDNGSTIKALSGDYEGASGSNHGFTSWDELWAYTSESSRRLWEELTPVPTRRNSIRFVSTYSGFESESKLLMDLYKQGVGTDECGEGKAEKIHSDLPVYANYESRLFTYWDHERRMPWQTPEYYEGQRKTLRPTTYARLHENRWSSSQDVFITAEMWDSCVEPGFSPHLFSQENIFVGVDCGLKHDNAAVVAVAWAKQSNKLMIVNHRIWHPTPRDPLDLENTIEWYLRQLHRDHRILEIICDP
jgi:phage terminase large subunit-like protein